MSDENQDNLVVPGKSGDLYAPWLQNCSYHSRRSSLRIGTWWTVFLFDWIGKNYLLSLASTCWTEVGSKRQKLDEPPAAWLSFKRQLIIWNCATSKYIKILDVNIPGAIPCLLPHQKPWTCWGNQRIFKQCSTDSCKCFSTLALVAKGIVCCSSMLSKFLVGSLSTPIASGWMLS